MGQETPNFETTYFICCFLTQFWFMGNLPLTQKWQHFLSGQTTEALKSPPENIYD